MSDSDLKFRHILELSNQEKKEFLNSFDMVLSDCDGVLWMIVDPIPQSGAALNLLKGAGKKCHLVSNNSIRPEEEYYDKLKEMGVIEINETELVTPIKSTINYLKKIEMVKPVFTITDENFETSLTEAGFKVLKMENKVYKNITVFANDIPVKEKVGAVIFDIDMNLNVAKINRGIKYLEDPECLFLVGACDAVMPLRQNFNIVGPEPFIEIIKNSSGKHPYVLGKPGDLLADYIYERFNIIDSKRVLFIGDNLIQDIGFALKNQFQSLLVLSGAAKKEDAKELPIEQQPHYYANSMADFIEFFGEFVN